MKGLRSYAFLIITIFLPTILFLVFVQMVGSELLLKALFVTLISTLVISSSVCYIIFRKLRLSNTKNIRYAFSDREDEDKMHYLRLLFNNVDTRIWIKDTKNNFIKVSKGAADDFACDVSDIEGRSSTDLYHGHGKIWYKQDLEVIKNKKPLIGIAESFITKDGKMGWIKTDRFPCINDKGEVEGVIVISQDVTRSLREERLIKNLYEAAIVMDDDINTNISRVLKLITEYLELDMAVVSKIYGNNCEIVHSYSSEYEVPNVTIPLEKTYCERTFLSDDIVAEHDIQRETYVELGEHKLYFSSYIGNHLVVGNERWGALSFGGKEGRREKFSDREIAFIRLVTQWLNHELTRQQYLDKLEESYLNLTHLVDQLRESNENLEHFAYVASHDLQEPLRIILNFSTILSKDYAQYIDKKGKCFLGYIEDGAVRMKELINDLLSYSSLQSKEEVFQEVDLNDILLNVQQNINPRIKESGALISFDDLPIIYGSRTYFIQLFQNLITNAIKYQKKGKKPVVEIGYNNSKDGSLIFYVQDNGIGIDPAYHKKIFDPFKRLHHRNEYQGTGIGLAICQEIVEKISGEIWLSSELGQGSTFYFSVPCTKSKNKSLL